MHMANILRAKMETICCLNEHFKVKIGKSVSITRP